MLHNSTASTSYCFYLFCYLMSVMSVLLYFFCFAVSLLSCALIIHLTVMCFFPTSALHACKLDFTTLNVPLNNKVEFCLMKLICICFSKQLQCILWLVHCQRTVYFLKDTLKLTYEHIWKSKFFIMNLIYQTWPHKFKYSGQETLCIRERILASKML